MPSSVHMIDHTINGFCPENQRLEQNENNLLSLFTGVFTEAWLSTNYNVYSSAQDYVIRLIT